MSFSLRSPLFAALVGVFMTTSCRADIVVTLGNVDLAPGGVGTMDIGVTSTNGDTLSSLNLELLITPVAGATSLLPFTSSSPDPYSNPNYVFSGVSFSSDFGLPFWGPTTGTNYPNDTITGGDSDDGTGAGYVTIGRYLGALNTFVAAVQFQAPGGATPGDQFQVSLVNDAGLTYFDDQNGNPLAIAKVSGGLVTVAVPEPSTVILLAISSLGLVFPRWIRRG